MRSKLLNFDLVGQVSTTVFHYPEESDRGAYLLALLVDLIFTEEDVDEYLGYLLAVERGEETLWLDGCEPLVLTVRPDGATIAFEMDKLRLPPRRYTLQEIRDALEDWRDYLRERAQEKEAQGG